MWITLRWRNVFVCVFVCISVSVFLCVPVDLFLLFCVNQICVDTLTFSSSKLLSLCYILMSVSSFSHLCNNIHDRSQSLQFRIRRLHITILYFVLHLNQFLYMSFTRFCLIVLNRWSFQMCLATRGCSFPSDSLSFYTTVYFPNFLILLFLCGFICLHRLYLSSLFSMRDSTSSE